MCKTVFTTPGPSKPLLSAGVSLLLPKPNLGIRLLCSAPLFNLASSFVRSVSSYYPSFTLATMVAVWAHVTCHLVDATEASHRLPAASFPPQSVIRAAAGEGPRSSPNMVALWPARNPLAPPQGMEPATHIP